MVLQDKTGTIDAKIWDLHSPGVGEFEAMDYVYVEGDVTLFQNAHQLNVRRIRKAREGEYVEADYLPVSKKDIKKMYEELLGFIKSVKNPYLNKLLSLILWTMRHLPRAFQFHSAAKTVHHGFVGGLLEHTLSVTKLCDYYASYYPQLNRDLLITAAIFHDIGKIKELSTFPENDYTDAGQLSGPYHDRRGDGGNHHPLHQGIPARRWLRSSSTAFWPITGSWSTARQEAGAFGGLALNFADNTDAKMET